MARLPEPGKDNGTWGDILNEYLSQALKNDGFLKDNSVTSAAIAPGAVTASEIASDAVTATQIADGTITEAQLAAGVQTKLNASAGAVVTTDITDSTAIGRAILTAADAAAVRSAIGAGTSNLAIGVTGSTAAAGNDSRLSDTRTPTDGSVTTTKVVDGAVTEAKLSVAVQAKLQASQPLRFAAAVAMTGVTPSDRAYGVRTLSGARMRVVSAPVGSALSVAVQHFGGSSWTTVGTLTIADGATAEVTTSFSQAQAIGNLVRLNVTSIGSTSAATGVAVDVLWS